MRRFCLGINSYARNKILFRHINNKVLMYKTLCIKLSAINFIAIKSHNQLEYYFMDKVSSKLQFM